MSIIFRAVVVTRGAQRLLSSASSIKFNFDSILGQNAVSCRCQLSQTTSTSFRRDYSTKSIDETSKTSSSSSDDKKLSNETEIVYNGQLSRIMLRLKLFSLSTSFIGLGLQPVLYSKVVTAGQVTAWTIPMLGVIAVMACTTPFLLHMVTRRYITKVEYDEKNDKYIASRYNIFGMTRKVEFTPDDVTIPTVQGMFSNCSIKGVNGFLDGSQFNDPNHYVRIMGYDKPLDFEVSKDEFADSDDEDWSKNNDKKTKQRCN